MSSDLAEQDAQQTSPPAGFGWPETQLLKRQAVATSDLPRRFGRLLDAVLASTNEPAFVQKLSVVCLTRLRSRIELLAAHLH